MEDNDENLYDIFLHKRDTSFTVPQLFQWVKDAGEMFATKVSEGSEGLLLLLLLFANNPSFNEKEVKAPGH